MPAPFGFAALLFPILIQAPVQAPAPAPTTTATPGREFFISWGYNGDSYTKSDMHFSQPSLGNDFTLASVQARDSKAWTDGLFAHARTTAGADRSPAKPAAPAVEPQLAAAEPALAAVSPPAKRGPGRPRKMSAAPLPPALKTRGRRKAAADGELPR